MKNKLLLILLSLFILTGCNKNNYKVIDNPDEFDSFFEGAIKYDIRDLEDCEKGHIPGFLCMGDTSVDVLIENIKILYKKKDIIIIIGEEEDVLYMLEKLSLKNYKYLYTYKGGYHKYAQDKGDSFLPEVGCDC